MKKAINLIFIALGCICLALGTVGIFLPVLPTTPLYLLTLFFFARGSKRFHAWFASTGLYDRYLSEFMATKTMTLSAKLKILAIATAFEAFGFYYAPWPARIVIVVLAVIHWVYFFRVIPTRRTQSLSAAQEGTPAQGRVQM